MRSHGAWSFLFRVQEEGRREVGDNVHVVISLIKNNKQQPTKSRRQGKMCCQTNIDHRGKYLGSANIGKQSEVQNTYSPQNSTDV